MKALIALAIFSVASSAVAAPASPPQAKPPAKASPPPPAPDTVPVPRIVLTAMEQVVTHAKMEVGDAAAMVQMDGYLKQILSGPSGPPPGADDPIYHASAPQGPPLPHPAPSAKK